MTIQERRRVLTAVCDRALAAMRAVQGAYRYADSTSPDPVPDPKLPDWATEAGIEFAIGSPPRDLVLDVRVQQLELHLDPSLSGARCVLVDGGTLAEASLDWPLHADVEAVLILDKLTDWFTSIAAKVRREADQAAATSERLARYREIAAAAMMDDITT